MFQKKKIMEMGVEILDFEIRGISIHELIKQFFVQLTKVF